MCVCVRERVMGWKIPNIYILSNQLETEKAQKVSNYFRHLLPLSLNSLLKNVVSMSPFGINDFWQNIKKLIEASIKRLFMVKNK